jgi:hypothetical protein
VALVAGLAAPPALLLVGAASAAGSIEAVPLADGCGVAISVGGLAGSEHAAAVEITGLAPDERLEQPQEGPRPLPDGDPVRLEFPATPLTGATADRRYRVDVVLDGAAQPPVELALPACATVTGDEGGGAASPAPGTGATPSPLTPPSPSGTPSPAGTASPEGTATPAGTASADPTPDPSVSASPEAATSSAPDVSAEPTQPGSPTATPPAALPRDSVGTSGVPLLPVPPSGASAPAATGAVPTGGVASAPLLAPLPEVAAPAAAPWLAAPAPVLDLSLPFGDGAGPAAPDLAGDAPTAPNRPTTLALRQPVPAYVDAIPAVVILAGSLGGLVVLRMRKLIRS